MSIKKDMYINCFIYVYQFEDTIKLLVISVFLLSLKTT